MDARQSLGPVQSAAVEGRVMHAVGGYQAGLFVNRDANVGVIVLANALENDTVDTSGLVLRTLDLLSK